MTQVKSQFTGNENTQWENKVYVNFTYAAVRKGYHVKRNQEEDDWKAIK